MAVGTVTTNLSTPATQVTPVNPVTVYVGIAGTADNSVVIETDLLFGHRAFMLMSTAGAMDVLVTLDGTNWSTAPLSLVDFGATTTDLVLVTAINRIYGFRGIFQKIRVLQNGGTNVANAVLLAADV